MNLNFFNRNKSSSNTSEVPPKNPAQSGDKVIENTPSISSVEEMNPSQDFSKNLENLEKLIAIKRGMDGKISPDEVLRVSGMTLDQLLNYLNGRKVSIEASGEEIMDTLEYALNATEGDHKEGLMQKFANDKVKRGIILLLILMGKFAPQAHGAEKALSSVKDKAMNKTETTFEKKTEPDNSTYHVTDKDLDKERNDAKASESKIEGTHNLLTLKLTDHFSTDSEKIIDGDKKIIEKDFKDFLSNLTPESAKKITASDLKVLAFCDKRPTTKWGTNEKLADERGISTVNFLESILKDPNSTKHLPKDISEQLQSVKITHEVYESKTGPDKGVKYITDLVNPDTGKNFTDNEVNKLEQEAKTNSDAQAKLLELHSACRGVVFNITALNENIPPLEMHMKTIDLKAPEPAVKHWLGGYNNVIIIADKTPSMMEGAGAHHLSSNKYIAKIISQVSDLDGVKKHVFGSFDSNGMYADSYKEVKDLKEVAKTINALDGRGDGNKEAALLAAIQALERFHPEPGDKTAEKILTDEPLQDVTYSNYAKLKMLSEEKNVSVAFAYGDDNKETLNEIGLDQVGKMLNDHILKLNGHPSTDKILEAKDGKTVEDHLGEIFSPLISKSANEATKRYTDINNSQSQYFEKMLKSSQEKVDKCMKVLDGISDKNSEQYKEASNKLSDAERTKNFNENKISSNKINAEVCSKYGPELKKLADAYMKTGDKSILSHPYFKYFAGLINERDPFNNQKNVDIGTEKFVDKIDLHNTK